MAQGDRLKAIRERTGLTQEEVADEMGLTKATISKWENDTPIPDKRIPKLAAALRMSPAELQAEIYGKDQDVVREPDQLALWRNRVSEAELDEGVRFLLLCLPVFADPDTRVVVITVDEFADRLHLNQTRVERDWPAMLDTPFVETFGPEKLGGYALKLRFP